MSNYKSPKFEIGSKVLVIKCKSLEKLGINNVVEGGYFPIEGTVSTCLKGPKGLWNRYIITVTEEFKIGDKYGYGHLELMCTEEEVVEINKVTRTLFNNIGEPS